MNDAQRNVNTSTSTKEPEVCRVTMISELKRRSSFTLRSIAGMDLAELSLLDALNQTAADILASIPAQRCIVYIYDKTANLLRPQIVVDCNAGSQDKSTGVVLSALSENTNIAETTSEDVASSPLISFPPVVGMVSSSFLQKRCLRMQEPNPHRAFHREYDVPKDMQVDSILCAPVVLYHRATAVIQLVNRLHTAGDRNPEIQRATTPQDAKDESNTEVTLRRLKTVKAMVQTGFSTKDEQKLLHFTTHIAQTIEINAKKLASVRNHTKIREAKAKQALDLLNALNGKVVAGVDTTEMLLPTGTNDADCSISMRHATISKLLSETGVLTDMLSALAVIMRLQAIFRGRRQRRADKFAEELEKFRRQRERMKTLIVVQRAVRSPDKTKPKEKMMVNRTKESSSRSKIRDEEPKRPQSPRKSLPTTPSTARFLLQQPVVQTRSPGESTRIQRRRMSATKIQKVFRRHRQRQQQQTPQPRISPAKLSNEKLTKETASAVKVQSFVRGSLVRMKLRQARLSSNGPHIICLRIASQSISNQCSHDSPRSMKLQSQTCVYAMPERPGQTHILHRRTRISRDSEDTLEPQTTTSRNNYVVVESRRLVSIRKPDESSRLINSLSRRSKLNWNRLASPVVWETYQQPGLEFAPPGVEFVQRHQSIVRPDTMDRQYTKVNSSRAMTAVPQASKDGKLSIKLPILRSRPQTKGSLLCCLLPAQTKDAVSPITVRPIAQMKCHQAKRLQFQSEAGAGDEVVWH